VRGHRRDELPPPDLERRRPPVRVVGGAHTDS
jgi:hypothetical protein